MISTQVLQEYFVNAVGKLHLDVTLARRRVELFAKFDVVIPSVEMILAAVDLQRLNSLSFRRHVLPAERFSSAKTCNTAKRLPGCASSIRLRSGRH